MTSYVSASDGVPLQRAKDRHQQPIVVEILDHLLGALTAQWNNRWRCLLAERRRREGGGGMGEATSALERSRLRSVSVIHYKRAVECVYTGKMRILSASLSAFYRFNDPHFAPGLRDRSLLNVIFYCVLLWYELWISWYCTDNAVCLFLLETFLCTKFQRSFHSDKTK